eukprot:3716284-Amphidinium_carterae.1
MHVRAVRRLAGHGVVCRSSNYIATHIKISTKCFIVVDVLNSLAVHNRFQPSVECPNACLTEVCAVVELPFRFNGALACCISVLIFS